MNTASLDMSDVFQENIVVIFIFMKADNIYIYTRKSWEKRKKNLPRQKEEC